MLGLLYPACVLHHVCFCIMLLFCIMPVCCVMPVFRIMPMCCIMPVSVLYHACVNFDSDYVILLLAFISLFPALEHSLRSCRMGAILNK